ncbi:MAG: VCBS repeat-containing protein [Candidatus Sumerlaeaceae bacterium]|nr:VCBS repeat-containing protein [Candidatus Sumerlaeaceae bacterium]
MLKSILIAERSKAGRFSFHPICKPWFLIWALLMATLPSFAARGFDQQSVTLAKQNLSPESKAHPVDLIADGRKELVVTQKNEAAVFAAEPKDFVLKQKVKLATPNQGAGNIFYTFGRLGQGERRSLMTMDSKGVYYYEAGPDNIVDEPRLLLKADLLPSRGPEKPPQYFDFALDLDNDGLDELLLPTDRGISIYHQDSPLKFSKADLPRNAYSRSKAFSFQMLTPADPTRLPVESGYTSARSGVDNLLLFDANGDGLQDLIFSQTNPGPNSKQVERYEIFLQRKNMSFNSEPSQIIEFPYEPNADVTFRDLNRDGKLDALLIKSNLDIINPKTVIKFYIAGRQQYQLFNQESDRFITKDPIGIVRIADFNNDGFVDFAMTYFSYQFGSSEDIVDFALANKMKFKLQFFLNTGAKGFSHQPSVEKEIAINLKPDSYRDYPPLMIVDDMNGDKVMDLAVRAAEDKLQIYLSNGNLSYDKNPAGDISIPGDAAVTVTDANGDGLADVIISNAKRQLFTVYYSITK